LSWIPLSESLLLSWNFMTDRHVHANAKCFDIEVSFLQLVAFPGPK
jgi:hypothetical protein